MYERSPGHCHGAGQVGGTMGGEPDDGVRSENAPGQRDWGVVLTDMDAVRPGFECKVGAVVEDERHSGVRADGADQCGPLQKGSGLEVFVPQLHDVHPAGDAGRHKSSEVGPVGCAEVEAAVRDGRHGPRPGGRHAVDFALAFAFTPCL